MNVSVSSSSTLTRNAKRVGGVGQADLRLEARSLGGAGLVTAAALGERGADVEGRHHAELGPRFGFPADAHVHAEIRRDLGRTCGKLTHRDGEHLEDVLEGARARRGDVKGDRAAQAEIRSERLEVTSLVELRLQLGTGPGDGDVAVGEDAGAARFAEHHIVDRHVHAISEPADVQRQVDQRSGRPGVDGNRRRCDRGQGHNGECPASKAKWCVHRSPSLVQPAKATRWCSSHYVSTRSTVRAIHHVNDGRASERVTRQPAAPKAIAPAEPPSPMTSPRPPGLGDR